MHELYEFEKEKPRRTIHEDSGSRERRDSGSVIVRFPSGVERSWVEMSQSLADLILNLSHTTTVVESSVLVVARYHAESLMECVDVGQDCLSMDHRVPDPGN